MTVINSDQLQLSKMEEALANRDVRRHLYYKYLEGYFSIWYYTIINIVGLVISTIYLTHPLVDTLLMLWGMFVFTYLIWFRWYYRIYYIKMKLHLKRKITWLKIFSLVGLVSLAVASLSLVESDHRTGTIAIIALMNPLTMISHRLISWLAINPRTPLNRYEQQYFDYMQPNPIPRSLEGVHSTKTDEYRPLLEPHDQIPRTIQRLMEDIRKDGILQECQICLEELAKDQLIATLPCFCVYHEGCISDWSARKTVCPTHPDTDLTQMAPTNIGLDEEESMVHRIPDAV